MSNTGEQRSVLLLVTAVLGMSANAASAAVEEITVTTRKTAENVQDVPIAITAIDTGTIEKLNIRGLEQVVELDTSVQIQQNNFAGGGQSITVRGLAPIAGRPNVATLIDGVDVTGEGMTLDGGSILINPRLIDIERIEVAKGPQSVLYGRSAFAGAVQYVTKNPTDTFFAEIGADIAEYGSEQLRGTLSGPLGETLGYRLNGLWYDEDGFYRNSLTGARIGGAEGWGLAFTLKWDPSDTLGFKWRSEYSDDEFGIPAQSSLPLNTRLTVDPLASECNTTPGGNRGPVVDRNCDQQLAAQVISDYFDDPDPNPLGLGEYDPAIHANQFNDMLWPIFTGTIPDVAGLERLTGYRDGIAISPNYQYGPGATDPLAARDYRGNARQVFRSTLITEWAFAEDWNLTSWTSLTNAQAFTEQDGDKFAVPVRMNPADPRSLVDNSTATLNLFQSTDTQLLSQEFRLAWDASDAIALTLGALFWYEDVELFDRSSPVISGGPQCFVTVGGNDAALDPNASFFFLYPEQHECGRTSVPVRDWVDEAFAENPGYFAGRETEHVSFYGSVDVDLSARWSLRGELRYSREDIETAGPRMQPCWEGQANLFTSRQAGCLEPFGVVIGPGNIVLCGQTGRCDTALNARDLVTYPNDPFPGSPTQPYADNEFGWWPYGFAPITARTETFNKTDDWVTPKLTLNFEPDDDWLLYGSWAVARKPGGFSLLTAATFGVDPNIDGIPDEIEFESEEMTVWELGSKSTLLGGRWLLNAAAFYQDFSDKQVRVTEVIGGTVGPVIRNASGAEVYGLELDTRFAATERLTIAAALTWLDAEYDDYTTKTNNANEISALGCAALTDIVDPVTGDAVTGACLVSRNGNALERAPDLSASLGINYRAPFGTSGREWYVEWRTLYEDEQFANAENNVILDARSVSDIWLGLEDERWDVQLYVRNVFDDDTIRSAGQTGPDLPNSEFRLALKTSIPPSVIGAPKIPRQTFANLPPPRQIGVQLRYRFGD